MDICEQCHDQINIHADGTAACSCATVDYQPNRQDWPEGWDAERVEELQARELLTAALEARDE